MAGGSCGAIGVTFRSFSIGLLSAILIAVAAPYNNLIVANTFLIGGTLPVVLVLVLLLIGVATHLLRIRFTPAELVIVVAMVLAGCGVSAIGFVQYVTGVLAGVPNLAESSPAAERLLQAMGLPAWVMPQDIESIKSLVTRVPDGSPMPGATWIAPLAAWSCLGLLMLTAIAMFAVLVRKQWVENERLPFPVATICVSLVRSASVGDRVGSVFISPLFWIAVGAVVVLRSLNVLHEYDPRVPVVSLSFDLSSLFASPPLSYATDLFYRSGLYFAVIGITFFLQTRIAFSIWFLYFASQFVRMLVGSTGGELTGPMQEDQTFGAMLTFVGLILWIGRTHWLMILRHMLGMRRETEHPGDYLRYSVAGWLMAFSLVGMAAWLVLAGAGIGSAVYITGFLGLFMLLVARIAAETGLYYVQIPYPITRPVLGAAEWMQSPPMSTRSYFWTSMFGALFAHDTREAAATYLPHALAVSDRAGAPRGRGIVIAVLIAVAVALPVAFASQLYFDFRFAATLADPPTAPVNAYAVEYMPNRLIVQPTDAYDAGRYVTGPHSSELHVGIGAGLTALFGVCRLRYEWFPLHPLGVLLVYSFPVARMWFSIFLGWLIKVIVVRLGGSALLTKLTPLFIGLVVGESLAAGVWLLINLVIATNGGAYETVYFTP